MPDRNRRGSVRRRVALGMLVVITVAVVIAVVAALRSGGEATDTTAATAAPTTSASASDPVPSAEAEAEPEPAEAVAPPAPPTPPEGAQEQPIAPEQEPVAPTETATGADGAQVALVGIESIDVVGQLPGEVSGTGVRVTVEISNSTQVPMNLDYVAVNLYVGAERTPALPIPSADSGGFGGELAVGDSASASYVFLLDEQARGDVLIGVDYLPGAATVTFRGALEG